MSKDPGPSVKIEGDVDAYPYLASLNQAQYRAVTAPPEIPLQILAGPGSGKTRVLTSRVAHLVRKHGYRPMEVTAVTFTNKAANEMKKRLAALLGPKDADALILGTFHATCARYLRRYGQLIDLANNFAIADADDTKKLMSGLIKARSHLLEAAHMQLKDTAVLSEISKAKAKGESPDAMAIRAASDPSSSTSTLSHIAELYAEYEAALREANSLDFDDLLVFGLRLFRTAPRVISHCRHILVDEFQDTNTTQYELMRCFAQANGGLSVVGDPDQSIYGWRSAEVENLNKMTKGKHGLILARPLTRYSDFTGVEAIYLEENYRSTGSILSAAHSVVSQDRDRIQKSLFTSHPKSTAVTLKPFSTAVIESSFIATEIKRLIAYSGGVLGYDDFAILLRYNALSRTIESALQKDSIPNRIVGGHKFFERMEIKDLLAYLQLAENPGFTPAFLRVVNVPRRAIGDKSVADLMAAAKKDKISPMDLCERIIDGDQLPLGLKPTVKKNLASFVGVVRKLRRAAQKGTSVSDLLHTVIEKTDYEEHLRKTQQDFDSRWENVQELISYSVVVAEEQAREIDHQISDETFIPASSAALEAAANVRFKEVERKVHPMFRRTSTNNSTSTEGMDDDDKPRKRRKVNGDRDTRFKGIEGRAKKEPIDLLDSGDDLDGEPPRNGFKESESSLSDPDEPQALFKVGSEALTPLSYFLQTSMLSTDTESKEDEGKQPKVTITTVHAAKGLEWPVVFIPAVEQGTYPSYRCTEPHEVAEERRLLYVAMTRAQVFLTLTHTQYRLLGGEDSYKELSEFVALSSKKEPGLFSGDMPDIDESVRKNMAAMLGRPAPDEAVTKEAIRKHVRAAPPLSMWDAPEPQDRNFNRFARREVTKATRAAEYWASDFDEYALPGMAGGTSSSSSGFQSARAGLARPRDRDRDRDRDSPASPAKPPPKPIKSRHVDIPAPLPFTFGKPDEKKSEAGLGSFTNASNNFLSNLDSLGVGAPEASTGGPSADGSPFASPNLDGSPKLFGSGQFPGPGAGLPSGGRVELAKGTKRLGMGRPLPWGAKR